MDFSAFNLLQPPASAARVVELEKQLAAARAHISELEKQRESLRASYARLFEEYRLLKRRLFIAKAERVDTTQLEFDFKEILAQLDAAANSLGLGKDEGHRGEESGGNSEDASTGSGSSDSGTPKDKPKGKNKPKGRRNLRDIDLPEIREEIPDVLMENLVAQGLAERIGFEESAKLAWERGGMRRLVVARVMYSTVGRDGNTELETAPVPRELIARSLAAPSLLAHVVVAKYNDGLPLWRLEDIFTREGVRVDRGTMCRWVDEIGGAFGATLVQAMRMDAFHTAFCLATDATGFRIQPERKPGQARRPCERGHYFVVIADRDHIWFEYTERETTEAVNAMLGGYAGYVQLDAKNVYDELFRTSPERLEGVIDEDEPERFEVGCWSHGRRKFWEAALARSDVARQALARIGRIFELDASWADKPPSEIKRLRDAHLRAHVDALFDWIELHYETERHVRSSLRTALGYFVRQRGALVRFLDDGRLKLDNNRSERALRQIAVGRKAWLFAGSHKHAENAAGILSVLASARLHRLDPERYVREMIRVLPWWPKARMLELTPKYWSATRSRLDPVQLAAEVGHLDVPESAATA